MAEQKTADAGTNGANGKIVGIHPGWGKLPKLTKTESASNPVPVSTAEKPTPDTLIAVATMDGELEPLAEQRVNGPLSAPGTDNVVERFHQEMNIQSPSDKMRERAERLAERKRKKQLEEEQGIAD